MQISLCTTEVVKVKVTIGSINILLLIIPLATKIYDTSIQNPPWVRGDTEKISFFTSKDENNKATLEDNSTAS